MNIFAFNGSPRKSKDSNTAKVINLILEKAEEADKNIKKTLISAGDIKIGFCRGCFSCIKTGSCPYDKNDDLGIIRDRMKKADIIIWGSPVYTYSVTGQMKTVMDRFCSWYHTMPLVGKIGISVATAGYDGYEQVHNLNEALLGVLGVPVILKVNAGGHEKGLIPGEKEKVTKIAEEFIPYLTGEKKYNSSEYMEYIFGMMKKKVEGLKDHMPDAYEHWKKSGKYDADNFAEVFEKFNG